jgi:hypothetical protein
VDQVSLPILPENLKPRATRGVFLARSGSRRRRYVGDQQSGAELEKRILRLHESGTGILKIGKALGIGTGTVQRVVMERPRPFEASASV